MSITNVPLLTKDDYANLAKILENVDVKGRKAAEYIAVLGAKLDNRVATWFDQSPTGFDIIGTAKTSEAFEAIIKERVAAAMFGPPNRNLEALDSQATPLDQVPLRAGYEQDT